VPETVKPPALHRILQASLGWTNSHLHQFTINGTKYAPADPDWSDELEQSRNFHESRPKPLSLRFNPAISGVLRPLARWSTRARCAIPHAITLLRLRSV
jgi:Plasmid pRiA4b ORF-3-like protein